MKPTIHYKQFVDDLIDQAAFDYGLEHPEVIFGRNASGSHVYCAARVQVLQRIRQDTDLSWHQISILTMMDKNRLEQAFYRSKRNETSSPVRPADEAKDSASQGT